MMLAPAPRQEVELRVTTELPAEPSLAPDAACVLVLPFLLEAAEASNGASVAGVVERVCTSRGP